ncbi:RanBP1 domain protein, partial [Cooperia oncophora]
LAVAAEQSKADSTKHKEGGEGDAEHGADEEYEPDVHFAPVVPLPDLVDVKTGEEEEQVVFVARAKLFRFIKETKENKERGVGDLKILRNPKNNAHRVVMRREQSDANFAYLPTIELNEKKGMPNVYNWICRDYSESNEGVDEIFTAKFKTAEIAKEFHDKFKEAAAAHPSASK